MNGITKYSQNLKLLFLSFYLWKKQNLKKIYLEKIYQNLKISKMHPQCYTLNVSSN